MYHQLKKCETRKLSPSKKRWVGPVRGGGLSAVGVVGPQGFWRLSPFTLGSSHFRCKDIKRLLVNFMYLQSLLQPKSRWVSGGEREHDLCPVSPIHGGSLMAGDLRKEWAVEFCFSVGNSLAGESFLGIPNCLTLGSKSILTLWHRVGTY